MRALRLALAGTAAALMVGCVGGQAPAGQSATAAVQQQDRSVRVALVQPNLGDALLVSTAPGQAKRLYIVHQDGRITTIPVGGGRERPFLNLANRISTGGERGLLGLAFHPGYARNGRLFVNFTDRAGDTRIVEFRRGKNGRVAATSGRVLLTIPQPEANHNGGNLAFGPDGFLYIGTGDGGGGGDPQGSGQRLNTLLGKLLRIDVNRRSAGRPYAIPAGNPFRAAGQRREIFAYGLRNPWRFSFDRTRGDLWIGDVGQGDREEIDFLPAGTGAGTNFGWNAFEGRHPYPGGGPVRGRRPTMPVAEYGHDGGNCSVTGGHVYRGRRVPALNGRYVYADFCSGRTWTMRAGPHPGDVREITTALGTRLNGVTSFGEDARGELLVIASGSLYRFVRG